MIDSKTLKKCIDILSELNAYAKTTAQKELILELGYIIKQELDLVTLWDNNNKNARNTGTFDQQKLLEDNAQLYKDNEALLKTVKNLNQIIENMLPYIQGNIENIKQRFDLFNDNLNKLSIP